MSADAPEKKNINEMDFCTLNTQPSPRYQLTYYFCAKYLTVLHSVFKKEA